MALNSQLSIVRIKAETLCWGIRFDESALKHALDIYPPLLGEVHIHAAHIFLDCHVPVNACVGESFVKYSPYEMKWMDGKFRLFRDDEYCCDCLLRPAPKWYMQKTSSGRLMCGIFALHGARTLALSEYVRCDYINAGKACQFCSVPFIRIQEKQRLVEIEETLVAAFQENPLYTVALSEGARYTEDRGAVYHTQMVDVVRKVNPDAYVSVEIVPPTSDDYIDMLVDVGATSLIMNLEFFDEALRKLLMPAKSEVSKDRYYSAWEYGVKRLDAGQVSSVLIVGVERSDLTVRAAQDAVSRGVIPTIMPFRPYDHSPMANFRLTSPDEYMKVSETVAEMLVRHDLLPSRQLGCTECGACSLEIDYTLPEAHASTPAGWVSLQQLQKA